MTTIIQNEPVKGLVHVFLEQLIQNKFGVFLEVCHDQFDPPICLPESRVMIRARTMVAAYRNKDEAFINKTNPGTVRPVAMAVAECSIRDQFVKKIGLQKSLHRLYRELSAKKKAGEI